MPAVKPRTVVRGKAAARNHWYGVAIASFAYGKAVPVVDVNIERVLRRYFAIEGGQKEVWQKAQEFLDRSWPKAHNLALMDLGALVCTPNPRCGLCPLQAKCQGKSDPLRYWKKGKKSYEKLDLHFALWIEDGKVALAPSKGSMYRGMLLLPEAKEKRNLLGTFKHAYTKYAITVHCYAEEPRGELCWMDVEKAREAHLPTLVKKALSFCDGLSKFF